MAHADTLNAPGTVTLEPLVPPPPAPATALDGVLGLGRNGVAR